MIAPWQNLLHQIEQLPEDEQAELAEYIADVLAHPEDLMIEASRIVPLAQVVERIQRYPKYQHDDIAAIVIAALDAYDRKNREREQAVASGRIKLHGPYTEEEFDAELHRWSKPETTATALQALARPTQPDSRSPQAHLPAPRNRS